VKGVDPRDLDAYARELATLPDALAARSPHRLPPQLRDRVIAAARARGTARPRFPRVWALAATAAAVLLAASLAWGLSLNRALADERTLLAQLRDSAAGQETVFEVVGAANATKVFLRAPGGGPSAPYGQVFTRPDSSQVVAMAGRLPGAPAGQSYHLWLTENGVTSLAGTITPNESGFGYFVFDAGHRGPAYASARLILQPNGSTAPAGTPIASFQQ